MTDPWVCPETGSEVWCDECRDSNGHWPMKRSEWASRQRKSKHLKKARVKVITIQRIQYGFGPDKGKWVWLISTVWPEINSRAVETFP